MGAYIRPVVYKRQVENYNNPTMDAKKETFLSPKCDGKELPISHTHTLSSSGVWNGPLSAVVLAKMEFSAKVEA